MKDYRKKAFTIMELLVTLLLSSLIITVAFKFYLNYESLIRGKNKQMECGKEMLQFYQVFKHEVDNASMMKTSGNRIILIASGKASVYYDFEKEFIVRSLNSMADTFFVQANNFTTLKEPVSGFDKVITFELQNCGETIPVSLVKEYTNDVLMNN